jgi:predicted DNA-binding transcriptional regulator AlpA
MFQNIAQEIGEMLAPQVKIAQKALALKTEAEACSPTPVWKAQGSTAQPRQIVRIRDFAARLGVSMSTYWRMVGSGVLDPPLRVGKRARGHELSYLHDVLDRLHAEQEAAE